MLKTLTLMTGKMTIIIEVFPTKLCIYIYNRISYAQVHELPQGYCGDNWEDTLFS